MRTGIAVLAVVVLAGCGGRTSAAKQRDYGRALQAVCQTLGDGGRTLQRQATAPQGQTPGARLRRLDAVRVTLSRFAGAVERGTDRLDRADPPDGAAAFDGAMLGALRGFSGRLRQGARATAERDRAALVRFRRDVEATRFPPLPRALARRAPACGTTAA